MLSLVVGRWSLVFGLWYLVLGLRSLVVVLLSLVGGLWSLVFGRWYFVFGLWPLVIGLWSLAFAILYFDFGRLVVGQRESTLYSISRVQQIGDWVGVGGVCVGFGALLGRFCRGRVLFVVGE